MDTRHESLPRVNAASANLDGTSPRRRPMAAAVPRREFLGVSSAAVAGILAAPMIWTRTARGAESANDRFQIAAIGVGGRGTEIATQAAALGDMVAVADVNLEAAEKFSASLGKPCEVYQDYRKIIDRKDVDAIICGTPDHWHTRVSLDAMRSGKDVYCEKPLTLTMEESQRITAETKRTGRIFQVGTQQRTEFDRCFLKAIVIARSGRLGAKLHATSSVGNATAGGPFATVPHPSKLDFNMWLGQAPVVDFCPERIGWNFRWWLEYSGGQVTDWGVHHTDIAIWALGGEQTGVVEVAAKGDFPGLPYTMNVLDFLNGRVRLPQQYNVAESFRSQLKLANGNTIELNSDGNELIIEGDKGKIRVNRNGLTGKPVEEIAADKSQSEWLEEEVRKLYRGMPLGSHMENFFHCLKSREMPISDVWTHCNSVNACHMTNISMLTKSTLRFDPAKYCFDHPVANELMRRAQRSPWTTS